MSVICRDTARLGGIMESPTSYCATASGKAPVKDDKISRSANAAIQEGLESQKQTAETSRSRSHTTIKDDRYFKNWEKLEELTGAKFEALVLRDEIRCNKNGQCWRPQNRSSSVGSNPVEMNRSGNLSNPSQDRVTSTGISVSRRELKQPQTPSSSSQSTNSFNYGSFPEIRRPSTPITEEFFQEPEENLG